jgi:dCMP deaminase
VSLVESDFYVHGLPVCSDCAKGIIQVGVSRVFMPQQEIPDHWIDSWDLTRSMFDEAGIKWNFLPV